MNDYTVGDTIYITFTSRSFSTGAPTTLAGTPVVSAYEDNSLTQITAGITLGVDHDSVTGLNLLTIVASGANGFESGKDYNLVITTGTVGGVSVVGETVGRFSLGRSAAAVLVAALNDLDAAGIRSAVGLSTANLDTQLSNIDNDTGTNIPNSIAALNDLDAAGVATAVWNAATATYGSAGSYGELIETNLDAQVSLAGGDDAATIWTYATRVLTANTNLNDPTAAAIADAVWDEELTGLTHNVVNSAGRRLRTLQTGGNYEGGMIWVDTINGTAGTVADENGTVTNPVDTWADALTLSASVNLQAFHIGNGSTITLTAASANYTLEGHEWTLALGGQSVASTMVIDASVSGTGTGTESEYLDCIFGITSLPAMQAYNCSFTATTSGGFTMSAAGDYRFINCQSGVAGSGAPLFTLGTGAITAEFRRWSGGITFAGITSDDTLTISGELGTVNLGSPTGGTVEIRGTYKAITNAGSATVNTTGAILGGDVASILADTGTSIPASIAALNDPTAAAIADQVWDELIAGHAISGSTGEALSAAGGAGDPWITSLPGSYTGTQAGKILADVLTDTGTTIPALFPSNFSAMGINVSGHVSRVTLVDTTTTNSDMRGTDSAYTGTPPTAAAISDAVWDELIAGHAISGSTGEALSAAGGAGDPWITSLPGSYTGTQAGKILADILVDTGTTLDGKLDTIDGIVDDILVDTAAIPAFPANFASLGINVSGHVSRVTLVDTTTTNSDMRGTDSAYTGTPPTSAAIADAVWTEPWAGQISDPLKWGGLWYAYFDGIQTATVTDIPAQITALNDLSAAEVNAEVVDALNIDTYAEPGQGTPAATLSLAAKINYLFKAWRNRKHQTAIEFALYNDDATTVDQKAVLSDDGTTTDIGEITTGP